MSNKRPLATTLSSSLGSSVTSSDEVTVLVFKDNDASRSFQVSLGWITRFGFALGALAAAALFGSFFAVKFYRVARNADPTHVIDLEQQLGDLKTANKGLEAKLVEAKQAAVASTQVAAMPTTAPTVATQATVNPLPVPTVTVTVTPVAAAPAAPPASTAAQVSGAIPLFTALPRQSQDLSANASKLPITVSPAHTSWSGSGRTFKVDFNIQYVGTDHGSQQGRIVVLARGTNALFGYPEGILGRSTAGSLISPQQGEYFSVSRFREVKAEFPEARGAGKIEDVEILILSLEGNLMFYQKLPAAQPPTAAIKSAPVKAPVSAAPKAAVSAPVTPSKAVTTPPAAATTVPPAATTTSPAAPTKPKSDTSDLIEPGVDQ